MITARINKFRLLFLSSLILFTFCSPVSSIQASTMHDDELEAEGPIQEIGSDVNGNDSLMVDSIVFYVADDTEIKGEHGTDLEFADLQAGMYVEVEGEEENDGRNLASKIDLKEEDDPEDFEVEGWIDSVGVASVFVGGYGYLVTDETEIEGEDSEYFTFADLHPGQYVEIKGLIIEDGDFWAEEIEIEDDQDDDFEFEGTIDSVGVNLIVVSGISLEVDANTNIEDDQDLPVTLADLLVGMRVEVKAAQISDNRLLALKIEVEDDFFDEIEVTGAIESITEDTLVVSGIDFITDENTLVEGDNDVILSLSDLKVGMIVEVEANQMPDGTFFAFKIKIEDFWQLDIEITATIDSLGSDFLILQDIRFNVDSNTIVLDNNNFHIEFSSLTVGLLVELDGHGNPGGDYYARKIKIEDEDQDEIEFYGFIDSLETDLIQVSGVVFQVNENTLILNHANFPIVFEQLAVDMSVEIKAELQLNGDLLASRIKIEDSPGFSEIGGTVEDISEDQISVAQHTYLVSEKTIVLDSLNQLIPIQNISPGSAVKIWADGSGTQTLLALQIRMEPATLTAIGINNDTEILPGKYDLQPNYPNPFNPETTIPFNISGNAFHKVQLNVYNLLGQTVKVLYDGPLQAGSYRFKWDGLSFTGTPAPSGIYFYELRVDNSHSQTRRMVLLK